METIKNQRGQLLIVVALSLVMLGLFVGLALDGGVGYLTRARLQITVDAAALAGARELLFGEDRAIKAACDLVAVNGGGIECATGDGQRFSVRVGDLEEYGQTHQAVFVTGQTTVRTTFMRLGVLFGCETCAALRVSALGVAVPPPELDILLIMDDTASMREGCDFVQTNGCPNEKERIGARAFVDLFLPRFAAVKIGLLPFRGCYNEDGADQCVRIGEIIPMTMDASLLNGRRGVRGPEETSPDTGSGIAGLWSQGGSGTNICKALTAAEPLIGKSELGRSRVVVLLTDADNHVNGDVPWECAADGIGMDDKTLSAAEKLKRDGVEIFVLGYGVNGNSDRQLAINIASSKKNYFEAISADDLPAKFEAVARELLRRVRLAI